MKNANTWITTWYIISATPPKHLTAPTVVLHTMHYTNIMYYVTYYSYYYYNYYIFCTMQYALYTTLSTASHCGVHHQGDPTDLTLDLGDPQMPLRISDYLPKKNIKYK